ncbi:WD40 repeat-like protein [Phanerochaete sordida]|uniref:WD40 repeat-like protein n=1 Tax=Phanerochaete sordida TaxID=48140 RepID=A0A9P3L7F9_9APHY|nr:WD40 repeat-like protein [Phanerochaete sordida]
MSPSSPPSSPSRPVLNNRTNAEAQENTDRYPNISIPASQDRKRAPAADSWPQSSRKRVRLDKSDESEHIDVNDASESEDDVAAPVRRPNWGANVFGMRSAGMRAGAWSLARLPALPSRSILQSFVSSDRSDVFQWQPVDNQLRVNLPYACAYSHSAKDGQDSLLAVSTEQGAVHILNTAKRQEWDVEPQRSTFNPHGNAIFDIQWSRSDELLATAAADQSVAVSQLAPHSGQVVRSLQHHTSTVKCLAWDPNSDGSILCSGSRDGTICVWDLREADRTKPSIQISKAHDTGKPPGRKGKLCGPPARGVTSLLFSGTHEYGLISAGSYDGILREWDLRYLGVKKRTRDPSKIAAAKCTYISSADPTTYGDTRRARGISSLAPGAGPSRGLLFALANDSRVHTYDRGSLEPLSGHTREPASDAWAYGHEGMRTNSFYVRAAVSPCGRWLANGGAEKGSVFLFDVACSERERMRAVRTGDPGVSARMKGVELRGQKGEVGAVDWAQDMLATCADDGTVRIWRPDLDVSRRCESEPEEMKWNWSWAVGR